MTKKSQSRLARDAQAKKQAEVEKALESTNVWDDVQNISNQCGNLLVSHTHLSQLSAHPEIIEAISDKKLFVQNINTLASDLSSMNKELQSLRSMHADKSGRATTPDEHIQGISLYEKYFMFIERHNNVVMPTATHLAEQIQGAVDQVAAQKATLTPEQDPSVITDVEVIDKTPSVH